MAAGIVDDPIGYPNCGHREIVGYRPPRLIDIPSVLIGFNEGRRPAARESHLTWIRAVAEARWLAKCLEEFQWWKDARDADKIAEHETHRQATTFSGESLDNDRPSIDLSDFAPLFEQFSGRSIADLSSPLRIPELTRGRVGLTILAVTRFRIRSSEIANLIDKHRSSMNPVDQYRTPSTARRPRLPPPNRTHRPKDLDGCMTLRQCDMWHPRGPPGHLVAGG
jgi:hypothetical protein